VSARDRFAFLLAGALVACGGHDAQAPATSAGAATAGWIQPEIIQRIVRGHFPVLRKCYEDALLTNPNLVGRVVVRFIIDANGEVHTAVDGGSDMPDPSVVDCVVGHFRDLSFPRPQPEGRSVTVVYPIPFSTAPK
jgi:hypothetical protein